MIDSPSRSASLWLVTVLLAVGIVSVTAQRAPDGLAGLRLDEALRKLQAGGSRIVFTSELVTPDMRVVAEPRSKGTKERLVELLEPHGLGVREGPRDTLLIVAAPRRTDDGTAPPPQKAENKPTTAAVDTPRTLPGAYREYITVEAPPYRTADLDPGSRRLHSEAWHAVGSHAADDPLRTVQTFPGVSGGDDFRNDLSVRASLPRHATVMIDGVAAPWLTHAAWGRSDTGTLTMLPNDVVGEATLSVGAYPRRDGSQLGPQLNLILREGSRSTTGWHVGTSRTSALVTGEGPIGSSRRGSWLVGLRRSYVEWPLQRSDHDMTVFGFTDLQSKVVYDVSPSHQVGMSLIAGLSNVERDNVAPNALADGTSRAALVSLTWRSLVGTRTVLRQQASLQGLAFRDRDQSRRLVGHGASRAGSYRVDLTYGPSWGQLDVGAQLRRTAGSRYEPRAATPDDDVAATASLDASQLERSGYVALRWTAAPGVTLVPGVRVAATTGVRGGAIDRWLQVQWSPSKEWRLRAGAGVAHQFPLLEPVSGWNRATNLRPERAAYLDVGVEQHMTSTLSWSATAFSRREHDVLRGPEAFPRASNGTVAPAGPGTYENALDGSVHGVDLVVERRSDSGLSGWVGYTLSVARDTDVLRHETFRADFDRRHTLNVAASAPLPGRTIVGATFRAGTNVPIPGYLMTRHEGRLFLGDLRNRAQLPPYARLDLRAERAFELARRQMTVFAETLNVLNRTNYGPAAGVLVPETGEVVGSTERLFPRLFTAGVRVRF
jgi:hypothetical protein